MITNFKIFESNEELVGKFTVMSKKFIEDFEIPDNVTQLLLTTVGKIVEFDQFHNEFHILYDYNITSEILEEVRENLLDMYYLRDETILCKYVDKEYLKHISETKEEVESKMSAEKYNL